MKASLVKNMKIGSMSWCFALINNRLAEIYFNKTKGGKSKIWAHCYARRNRFKTKHEQCLINIDTKRVKLVYRNRKYRDKGESKKPAVCL